MSSKITADYERRTKVHLLYARLLVELGDNESSSQYASALLYASIVQMNLAYNALIDELQARLNVAPNGSYDLTNIASSLQAQDIHSEQLQWLLSLEQNQDSWLTQMRQSMEKIPTEHKTSTAGNNSSSQVITKDGKNDSDPCRWVDQMDALCAQIRQAMIEY